MARNLTMTSVLDDVYDLYGTLDELEQFTEAVRRWDVNAAKGLPDYMKICFFGFYNTVNEMAYNTLANHKTFVVQNLKNAWIEYCEAILIEARWFNSGYIPTLDEYLEKAAISVALPVIVLAAYYLDSYDFMSETLHKVIYSSAVILRLTNDLATSVDELERGDATKAVECYMHETGASREEAMTHIKRLIIDAHKKINKERLACKSSTLQMFMEYVTNLGRIGQFTYNLGDMFTVPDDFHTSHHQSLLFEPKS